jgi:hypothetical protein
MDISALSTPTQMILALVMFSILLAWFILFAALAFRREPTMDEQWDEQPTPAGSFPAVPVQVGRSNTAN